jgi:hypothetical protein
MRPLPGGIRKGGGGHLLESIRNIANERTAPREFYFMREVE